MLIRPFRTADAAKMGQLAAQCARGEADFVLNPLWETPDELFAEFGRFGVDPESHLWVADAEEEGISGLVGFLRAADGTRAGLVCPIVRRQERGRGLGGELLRKALAGGAKLGIELATAAVGTRNRAGYSLLTAYGFRPMRQVYVMRCNARTDAKPLPIDGLRAEPALHEDASAILEVYRSCNFNPRTIERMEKFLSDGRHDHVVARREDGGVVAFVELETHWPARPWVAFVGVVPELRDRGLGSTLVGWALDRRFDQGATSALLMLSPANRTAVRTYEKAGFRRHRLVDVLERNL